MTERWAYCYKCGEHAPKEKLTPDGVVLHDDVQGVPGICHFIRETFIDAYTGLEIDCLERKL